MYKILHFSGGVYKFDLLKEHVEDVGGLLIQERYFHKSRGSYFLSEEIQVIFIVPPNEVSSIELLAKEIKGEICEVEMEEPLKSDLISSLNIYNILCKAGGWITPDFIRMSKLYHSDNTYTPIRDNPYINGNSGPIDDNQHPDNLEQCLNLMLSLKVIEKKKKNDKIEYRIR